MRNYAPIIGLLLLLGLFAGTWLLLQPSEPQPTGAGNIDDSVATLDNSGHVPSSVYSEEGNTTDRSDPLSPTRSDDPPVDPTGEVAGPDKPPGEIIGRATNPAPNPTTKHPAASMPIALPFISVSLDLAR